MTTVLYVHGLESGPRGDKARALEAAGYAVVSAQMPCGSAATQRDPVVLSTAVAGVVVLGAGAASGLEGFLVALLTVGVLQVFARAALTRRMFRRSVAIQVALLKSQPIDVVVGSSFGGAVCLELLRQRAWAGPTVLLCPAHQLVAARSRTVAKDLGEGARVLVVHGLSDEIVPIEHSRQLVKNSQARLIEVDDSHRLKSTATADQFKQWIEAVTAPGES